VKTRLDRTQLRLVTASENLSLTSAERHGVYPLRDERRVREALRPRTGNVSNVIPLRKPPTPPDAA